MDIQEKTAREETTRNETTQINPLPFEHAAAETSPLRQNIFKCRDKELRLGAKTIIMGVLNLTPDSFYDGGKYTRVDKALRHVEQMIEEGADIIDIGGESTRPGSLGVSEQQECERVIPVIKEIHKRFDIILSVDTTKSGVALQALKEGASIINDISGFTFDEKTADAASYYGAGVVLAHTSSRPKDMQQNTQYESLTEDIIKSLRASINIAEKKGIDKNSIIVDPGFGFGKTTEQNLTLLKNLSRLRELGKPILIGTSNKSFIGKTLNAGIDERLEGTMATVAIGISNGASIVRVHDIAEMKRVCAMVDAVLNVN
jgi:dihydropteroate synthase